MNEHPIEALMQTTMQSLKEIVDVNTIVGEPVETEDGTVVIPISRITLGFASGGGEYQKPDKNNKEQGNSTMPFAGGTGAGVSVEPVAFMVVAKDNVRLLPANSSGTAERILDLAPQLIDEFVNSIKKFKSENRRMETKRNNME